MPETYESEARLIDEALVYLGCSDCRLPSDTVVHCAGQKQGMKAILAALHQCGLAADDLDKAASLPSCPTHLLLGANKSNCLFDLFAVERLGFMAAKKLRLFGMTAANGSLCRVTETTIQPNGQAASREVIWSSAGGQWFPASRNARVEQRHKQTFTARQWRESTVCASLESPIPVFAALSVWSRKHLWSIEFRLGDSPGLWIATDAIGARELLRMRDVPDGKTRREALRHWVQEHWRKFRVDPATETQVRQHLRGSEQCSWFGLNCKIVPSTLDSDKNTALKTNKVRTHRLSETANA